MQDRSVVKQVYGGTFTFEESETKHEYRFNGEFVNGTTTLLKRILAKPKLMNWMTTEPLSVLGWYNNTKKAQQYKAKDAGMDVDTYLESLESKRLGVFNTIVTEGYQSFVNLLELARNATKKKMDDGAAWGSRVHEACESYVKTGIITSEEDIRQSVVNFADFLKINGYTVLFCEECVFSKELFMGGTIDLILQDREGKMYIADIKTTSGIFTDAAIQLGFYDIFQREMGLTDRDADGYIIINLKKDSTIDSWVCYLTDAARKTARGLEMAYRGLTTIMQSRDEDWD